ncbi:MAG TPA: hypothetical protein VJB12_03980 [Candidatus Nanoarchaeia archaeon]|nr:hypothetical protein [Candidatus Nanoarchaeia archaeon]
MGISRIETAIMESKEMIITYETLFDLLKREKDRVELQKLEPEFFANVLVYLRDKRQFAHQQHPSYDGMMKAQREMDNIRKLIKEFYDRREKKIVLLALDQSKTKSNLVDYSHMLREERELFDRLTSILDGFRDGILGNLLNEKLPAVHTSMEQMGQPSPQNPQQTFQIANASNSRLQDAMPSGYEEASNENSKEGHATPSALDESKPTILVRFLHPVPKFVGPELDEYGPFSEDDIANLPREVAGVLLGKGRVEEIHEE